MAHDDDAVLLGIQVGWRGYGFGLAQDVDGNIDVFQFVQADRVEARVPRRSRYGVVDDFAGNIHLHGQEGADAAAQAASLVEGHEGAGLVL